MSLLYQAFKQLPNKDLPHIISDIKENNAVQLLSTKEPRKILAIINQINDFIPFYLNNFMPEEFNDFISILTIIYQDRLTNLFEFYKNSIPQCLIDFWENPDEKYLVYYPYPERIVVIHYFIYKENLKRIDEVMNGIPRIFPIGLYSIEVGSVNVLRHIEMIHYGFIDPTLFVYEFPTCAELGHYKMVEYFLENKKIPFFLKVRAYLCAHRNGHTNITELLEKNKKINFLSKLFHLKRWIYD